MKNSQILIYIVNTKFNEDPMREAESNDNEMVKMK